MSLQEKPSSLPFLDRNWWNKDHVRQALSIYDDSTLYVEQMLFGVPLKGFGSLTVRYEHSGKHFSPEEFTPRPSTIPATGFFELAITDNHTRGHFTQETGLSVLAGHKQLAAVAQVFEAKLTGDKRMESNQRLEIGAINRPLVFRQPIFPGDIIEILVEEEWDFAHSIRGNARILVKNQEVTRVEDITLRFQNNLGITQDRIIEAAAQALGCLFMRNQQAQNLLPVLRGITTCIFNADQKAFPGQTIEMQLHLRDARERQEGFEGDVVAKVEGREIGTITGINCALVDRARLVRVLTRLREKRQKDYE